MEFQKGVEHFGFEQEGAVAVRQRKFHFLAAFVDGTVEGAEQLHAPFVLRGDAAYGSVQQAQVFVGLQKIGEQPGVVPQQLVGFVQLSEGREVPLEAQVDQAAVQPCLRQRKTVVRGVRVAQLQRLDAPVEAGGEPIVHVFVAVQVKLEKVDVTLQVVGCKVGGSYPAQVVEVGLRTVQVQFHHPVVDGFGLGGEGVEVLAGFRSQGREAERDGNQDKEEESKHASQKSCRWPRLDDGLCRSRYCRRRASSGGC